MKFLAVDPSSTILGWALFNEEALVAWGTINTKGVPYERKFMYIVGELKRLQEAYGFTEVACERAIRFYGKRIPALEVAVTSIRKWAEMGKLRISFYSPAEWKRSVTGSGRADKTEIAQVVSLIFREKLQLPAEAGLRVKLTDHETDAMAIGRHHYGIRKLERMAADA